jgi:hypothetical protein
MFFRLSLIAIFAVTLCAPSARAQARRGALGKAGKGKQTKMLDQFSSMSPEEQQRVLNNLPPERRKQVERNLERYNRLPDDQKKKLHDQFENFRELPKEQQQTARKVFQEMRNLDPERRIEVRRAAARLRNLPEEDRKALMNSEAFKKRFNEDEQRIINELTTLLPPAQ